MSVQLDLPLIALWLQWVFCLLLLFPKVLAILPAIWFDTKEAMLSNAFSPQVFFVIDTKFLCKAAHTLNALRYNGLNKISVKFWGKYHARFRSALELELSSI